MDIIQTLNLATAGELALISFLIGIATQSIKKTGKVSSEVLPLVSMVIGIVVGLVAVFVTKDTNYLNGAIAGLIVGAATSGLVDLGSGTTTAVSTTVSSAKSAKADKVAQAQTANEQAISKAVADYMASQAGTTPASSGGETSETK